MKSKGKKFYKKIYELGKPPSKSEFRVWAPWTYLEAILLNELRGCWNAVLKETGIVGVPKMLRKTFSSIAKLELGTTSKARVLTGHEQDSTLDIHYDKSTEQQRKQYANQVSKLFDFEKASNE